ncbi:hypothetical protein LCGC14_2664410 [marine sediment metagenome]|uniref:Uncharacterized protein n=1 Tax=marine sediment metagenome TaxID=412755 RepID=A0A0F8ZQZ3_9ZZZZ
MIGKKAVVIALVATALLTMSIFGAGLVIAQTQDFAKVFTGDHEAQHEDMHAQCEGGLDKAVEDGKITETQREELQALMDKKKADHDNMKALTPEERRETMETHHNEITKWAEDNNVDLKEILGHTSEEGEEHENGHGPRHGMMGSGRGPGAGMEM